MAKMSPFIDFRKMHQMNKVEDVQVGPRGGMCLVSVVDNWQEVKLESFR